MKEGTKIKSVCTLSWMPADPVLPHLSFRQYCKLVSICITAEHEAELKGITETALIWRGCETECSDGRESWDAIVTSQTPEMSPHMDQEQQQPGRDSPPASCQGKGPKFWEMWHSSSLTCEQHGPVMQQISSDKSFNTSHGIWKKKKSPQNNRDASPKQLNSDFPHNWGEKITELWSYSTSPTEVHKSYSFSEIKGVWVWNDLNRSWVLSSALEK